MNKKAQMNVLNNFWLIIVFLGVCLVSGILAGIAYYELGLLDNILHTVNFQIPIEDNSTMTSDIPQDFQGILGMVVFPILSIKNSLPYLVYFMIFGFIIALMFTAYVSSKNPVFFVLHLLLTFVLTYFSFILSNSYTTILENPTINSIMQPFTAYNLLMTYLPQIIFFTSLIFGVISFVNVMKPNSNISSVGLNYGGES